MPHSTDLEYAERAIPQYERAVEQAGAEAVRIALAQPLSEVQKMIDNCDGILLPGSNADVDPSRFGAGRSPHTAPPDPRRDAIDELLLEDAYRLRKPVLGVCYGLQSLNVFRSGSLIQHIPDSLPEELRHRVDHEAGKNVAVAHAVEIADDSTLAKIVKGAQREELRFNAQVATGKHSAEGLVETSVETEVALMPEMNRVVLPVNSSHHQAAETLGDGLCIAARCPDDGIIEALEGTSPDHFVLAVQWHPERSVDEDEASRAIFKAFVEAARTREK